MLRKLFTLLLLPVGGLLVGLVLIEALLRVAHLSFPVFDAYDDDRGVALVPGKDGRYQKEGNAYLRINSLGYRDSEHAVAKPAGTYRIAVLGDSFAEARQVAQENTFWSLLAGMLQSCRGGIGQSVEMLNFGIGGYGTTEELLTLRKDALRFSPDLVLLAFYPGNDLQDNSKQLSQRESWRMPRPYYVRSAGKLVLDDSFRQSSGHQLAYKAIQYSRLLELLNEVRHGWAARVGAAPGNALQEHLGPPSAPGIYAPPADVAWSDAWLITEELLDRTNQEVKAAGARLVVMTVSTPPQVYPDAVVRRSVERRLGVDDLFYADRRIGDAGRRSGFPVISLAEPLQKIATDSGTYLHGFSNTAMGEGHWNEAGHRQAAQILAHRICSEVLGSAP